MMVFSSQPSEATRRNRPKPPEISETDPGHPGDGLIERPSKARPQPDADLMIDFFNTISPEQSSKSAAASVGIAAAMAGLCALLRGTGLQGMVYL